MFLIRTGELLKKINGFKMFGDEILSLVLYLILNNSQVEHIFLISFYMKLVS